MEIEALNQEIDLRIIKDVSYRRQALRHKMLTAQLHRLTRRESSVFGRVFGFAF
jgi:FixJ family two-component response regulator